MPPAPIDAGGPQRDAIRIDILIAVVVAALLSISWAVANWDEVGRLTLPDADDMMRLAQVRDWLAGQAMNDWTQYRMAPPNGSPMHWSRLNDLGIAGIILATTPLTGRADAELMAVLLYPALLFALSIFLTARIARRLWSPQASIIAAILAGLAYPGTTLFIPGRIDHHALQVVTVQLAVLALMRGTSTGNGVMAGLAIAISLMIGLETGPQTAMLIATLFAFWAVRGPAERGRLAGFAISLGGMTLFFVATMRPTYWSSALCDAFTPASATAIIGGSTALAIMAAATPKLGGWRSRTAAGLLIGGGVLTGTVIAYPACVTGPYGDVDPFLMANFISNIDEANSIFDQQSVARAISLVGIVLAGCIASTWMIAQRPARWMLFAPVVAVIAISALVALFQVRGVYIGAPLAVPVLAGVVVAARDRVRWRRLAIVGAWLSTAGIVYLELPRAVEQIVTGYAAPPPTATPQRQCIAGDTWRQVDRFPAGVTMAPTNMASYLIGSTHLSTVGAGYHRNNRGNMAMYRYFLSSPAAAERIAREWNVTYVAFCPGDFTELQLTQRYPGSLASVLQSGHVPAGFRQLPLHNTRLRLYRIRP